MKGWFRKVTVSLTNQEHSGAVIIERGTKELIKLQRGDTAFFIPIEIANEVAESIKEVARA